MSDRIPVVILGAGGYAAIVHEILSNRKDVDILGCTDKVMGISERVFGEGVSVKILGDDTILPELSEQHPGLHVVFALGPELIDVRAKLIHVLEREGIPALTAIHPSAVISAMSQIGTGTVVRGGAVIGARNTIGDFCVINLASSIDHDTALGTNVFVGQGAHISSYVHMHDNVMVEMGASVNSQVTVGTGAHITGGSFVNTDVPEHSVVSGVPARVVRTIES
jgi:acetyltransferase EpsM